MHDWRYGSMVRSNFWHSRSLPTNWLIQMQFTYQDGGGNGDSTGVNWPGLLQGLHIYIQPQNMYLWRIQEGCIRHSRGIATILDKTLQEPRRNGLPEELIWLVCYEQIVKGKQQTILFHVDDLKMSHVDSDIFSSVLSDIDAEYGKILKMTITQVNIHK